MVPASTFLMGGVGVASGDAVAVIVGVSEGVGVNVAVGGMVGVKVGVAEGWKRPNALPGWQALNIVDREIKTIMILKDVLIIVSFAIWL